LYIENNPKLTGRVKLIYWLKCAFECISVIPRQLSAWFILEYSTESV